MHQATIRQLTKYSASSDALTASVLAIVSFTLSASATAADSADSDTSVSHEVSADEVTAGKLVKRSSEAYM